jgi:glucokinase
MLTLGTGVGGGIVVFNKLLRGPDGTAGEVGHIGVEKDGRSCHCGSLGCLEAYASVGGFLTTVRERLESGQDSLLRDLCRGDLDTINGAMVSEAAAQGDACALDAFRITGDWLGVGIASLVNLLNPEMIVLGGGLAEAGEVLFAPVRETVRARAFEVPARRAQIVPAALGTRAGVIGAARCALERFEAGA